MSLALGKLQTTAAKKLANALGLDKQKATWEAKQLAKAILKLDDTDLVLMQDKLMSKQQSNNFADAISKRSQGALLSHVIGTQPFLDSELLCNEKVLIPRPETETLVEETINFIADQPMTRIADFGTGSGAIALSLAKHFAQAKVEAFEKSKDACLVASKNFKANQLKNIKLFATSWHEAKGSYDLIITNPPYVTTAECKRLIKNNLLKDPYLALDGGLDGLDCIREILVKAKCILNSKGIIAIEHGAGQHYAINRLLIEHNFELCHYKKDLQGIKRVIIARMKI